MYTILLDYSTVPRRHIAFNGAQTKWWQHLTVCLFVVLHSLLEVKVTEHERDTDTRGGHGFGLWQLCVKTGALVVKDNPESEETKKTRSHRRTQTRTQRENGNDVCRVDMAVALAECVDTSAWLDGTFLWFVMSQSTKQPARAKPLSGKGKRSCVV